MSTRYAVLVWLPDSEDTCLDNHMIRMMFETDVPPLPTIWRHYVREDLRKRWETDLESISFDGPIATGTFGTMGLSGMPPIQFLLGRVEENREFADEMDIPDMGKLVFKHKMFTDHGANYWRQTVTLFPLTENTGEKERGFFRQVT